MYCNQCGNLIPDNGLFCTFCGAKAEVNTISPAASAVKAKEAPAPAAPVIMDGATSFPENFFGDDIVPGADIPEASEKYYTTKHIVLCLVIAGVMAAAAGVFAGLYFSLL